MNTEIAQRIPRDNHNRWVIIRDGRYHRGFITLLYTADYINGFVDTYLCQNNKCAHTFDELCLLCYDKSQCVTQLGSGIFMVKASDATYITVNKIAYIYSTGYITFGAFRSDYPAYCILCNRSCRCDCKRAFISDFVARFTGRFMLARECLIYDILCNVVEAMIYAN